MKLKFELKHAHIEFLHRILHLVHSQYWGADQIMFYFDEDTIIFYPAERAGFDKIFSRILLSGIAGDGKFFTSYTIKSLKEKSAILISPKSINQFIVNLKSLVDSHYDASFKLTQLTDDSGAKK